MRKKLLALVSAVAIGIALFAAVGMFSSPPQAQAAQNTVLVFNGLVGVGVFPIQVGGRVSGVDLANLSGQGFDVPVRPGSRFYCRFTLATKSVAGDVVTLEGTTVMSNNTFVNNNPVPVEMAVDLVTGDIIFHFDVGNTQGLEGIFTGTGHVRVAGRP